MAHDTDPMIPGDKTFQFAALMRYRRSGNVEQPTIDSDPATELALDHMRLALPQTKSWTGDVNEKRDNEQGTQPTR